MPLNVPLAGSMVPGPLGLVHLPRMWQKALLSARSRLPADYVFGDRGFDVRMMDGVGIEAAAFLPFLAAMPTYLATEAWVRDHATKLDATAATSDMIRNRAMSPEHADKIRAAIGITDASFDNGARLGNLDDAIALHGYVLAHRGQTLAPIIPAISSHATGPLGLTHLMRLWAKAIIKTGGALPEGYHSGSGPIDVQLAETIGLDLAASVRYTGSELPTYLTYERWVQQNATALDPATIAAWNERMVTREKPVPMATEERALLGVTDERVRGGLLLNDLVDWHLWHAEITA